MIRGDGVIPGDWAQWSDPHQSGHDHYNHDQSHDPPEHSTWHPESGVVRHCGDKLHTTSLGARDAITSCNIKEHSVWLKESVNTLYKYSAIGWPAFPKRLHLRNGRIATTCRLTKAWLVEVTS